MQTEALTSSLSDEPEPPLSPRRPSPYVGPRSFRRGETLFGRQRELTELLHLLVAERIVLCYSPSGAGKTSLIQAALIPALEQRRFRVLPPLRVSNRPPPGFSLPASANRYLFSLLLSLEEGRPEAERLPHDQLAALSLDDYLNRLDNAPGDLVLIFDQFEEILTVDPTDRAAKEAFFEQVGQALQNRRRWALFAMREDYLAMLEPFLRPIPTRLEETFRLDLLDAESALEAVQEPARLAGVVFTDLAAARLVDDLRRVQIQELDGTRSERLGLYVEPVQLQVVCLRLWEQLAPDDQEISEADLQAVGDVDSALAAYYADRVAQAASQSGVSERQIREWCDTRLITAEGSRRQVLRERDSSEGLPNTAVAQLVSAHLVRGEQRLGATWYELAHDRLIGPVRKDNAAWRTQHLSAFQRRARQWQAERHAELLLRGEELRSAQRWAAEHPADLTEDERAFLSESDKVMRSVRLRRNLIASSLITLVLLLGLMASLWFAWNARQQQQTSNANVLAAQAVSTGESDFGGALAMGLESNAIVRNITGKFEGASPPIGSLLTLLNRNARLSETLVEPLKQPVRAMAVYSTGDPATAAMASINREGTIIAWRLGDTGLRASLFGTHALPSTTQEPSWSLSFSSDGARLASAGSATPLIRLWSVEQRRTTALLTDTAGLVQVAFQPAGDLLASSNLSGTARLWDTRALTSVWTLPIEADTGRALAFSPDGRRIALSGVPGNLWLCEVGPRTCAALPVPESDTGVPAEVTALAFQPDGIHLALGDGKGWLRWLDLSTGQWIGQSWIHNDRINTLAFSPDGSWLASGSDDNSVIIWQASSNKEPQRVRQPGDVPFQGHRDAVQAVGFLGDQLLASGSDDALIKVWNTDPVFTVTRPYVGTAGRAFVSMTWSGDGTYFITGDDERQTTWSAWNGDEQTFGDLRTLQPSADDQMLDQANAGRVNISDVTVAAPPPQENSPPERSRLLAAITPSGRVVLGNTQQPEVSLPLEGGDALRAVRFHNLAFHPNGRLLIASGCGKSDCTQSVLVFWDVATRQPMALQPVEGAIRALAVSPDGQILAVAVEERIELWDTARYELNSTLLGHSEPVLALAFRHDGTLASGGCDRVVRLWYVGGGRQLGKTEQVLGKVQSCVTTLAFDAGGGLLAVGSDDATISLWSVTPDNFSLIQLPSWLAQSNSNSFLMISSPLRGHLSAVTGVMFSRDNRQLVSIGYDGLIIFWSVNAGRLVQQACTAYQSVEPADGSISEQRQQAVQGACAPVPAGEAQR
ncbi:MAG: PD40 domain-containing protein [Roseiflexaceae bacterium]